MRMSGGGGRDEATLEADREKESQLFVAGLLPGGAAAVVRLSYGIVFNPLRRVERLDAERVIDGRLNFDAAAIKTLLLLLDRVDPS